MTAAPKTELIEPDVPAPLADGPAADLSPQQRRFVELLVEGPANRTKAAVAAGYSKHSAKFIAHRLWQHPAIRAYHTQLVEFRLGRASARAAEVIEALLDSPSHFVRLEAAKDILDRAGHKPVERKQLLIGGSVSVEIDLKG